MVFLNKILEKRLNNFIKIFDFSKKKKNKLKFVKGI